MPAEMFFGDEYSMRPSLEPFHTLEPSWNLAMTVFPKLSIDVSTFFGAVICFPLFVPRPSGLIRPWLPDIWWWLFFLRIAVAWRSGKIILPSHTPLVGFMLENGKVIEFEVADEVSTKLHQRLLQPTVMRSNILPLRFVDMMQWVLSLRR